MGRPQCPGQMSYLPQSVHPGVSEGRLGEVEGEQNLKVFALPASNSVIGTRRNRCWRSKNKRRPLEMLKGGLQNANNNIFKGSEVK